MWNRNTLLRKSRNERSQFIVENTSQGLASHCKAKITFTFLFSIINALESIWQCWNKGMKSESGFSFAMASQPFQLLLSMTRKHCPTCNTSRTLHPKVTLVLHSNWNEIKCYKSSNLKNDRLNTHRALQLRCQNNGRT